MLISWGLRVYSIVFKVLSSSVMRYLGRFLFLVAHRTFALRRFDKEFLPGVGPLLELEIAHLTDIRWQRPPDDCRHLPNSEVGQQYIETVHAH